MYATTAKVFNYGSPFGGWELITLCTTIVYIQALFCHHAVDGTSSTPIISPAEVSSIRHKLHLMVRLQFLRSEEFAVPLYCNYNQVYSAWNCSTSWGPIYRRPVGWDSRIHWLHLCRKVRSTHKCSWYDTRQSNGEAPLKLEPWGMRSTPSLPSLLDPHWPRVEGPERVQSMGQKELFDI